MLVLLSGLLAYMSMGKNNMGNVYIHSFKFLNGNVCTI